MKKKKNENDNKSDDFNPDVLNCIANLSNDEVFTPPTVANEMLDLLPKEIWKDKNAKFLDPFTKSGVFLREITKRLIKGAIPHYQEMMNVINSKKDNNIPLDDNDTSFLNELQKTIDHILHNQVYGIAITELTSLLARRSLYCSKYPNCKYSISRFDTADGNIRFKRVEHTWKDKKCIYCGASQDEYDRDKSLETYAYEFIHVNDPKEIFNMKFDVIIGNPPYQMSTGGSVESQALPIYQKFVEQAKKLNPKYLSMIIPSRWMIGGFGLDSFRNEMISDKRIKVLHDFLDANDCFSGVSIPGGVCYFLWDSSNASKCEVFTHKGNNQVEYSTRFLKEDGVNTFIRFNEGVNILNKVRKNGEVSFSSIVSPRDPFGLNYYEDGSERMFKIFETAKTDENLQIYYNGWQNKGILYANKKYIQERKDAVSKYKVFISKANGAASSKIPYAVISRPFVGDKDTICNMTYLMVGPFDSKAEATNVVNYMSTKFFRFLVSLLKSTQNALKQVYQFVPMQDFSKPWTDEELYKKYNLTQEEIAFIESMIKPMDLTKAGDADEQE